jgi:hypothetical protein
MKEREGVHNNTPMKMMNEVEAVVGTNTINIGF